MSAPCSGQRLAGAAHHAEHLRRKPPGASPRVLATGDSCRAAAGTIGIKTPINVLGQVRPKLFLGGRAGVVEKLSTGDGESV